MTLRSSRPPQDAGARPRPPLPPVTASPIVIGTTEAMLSRAAPATDCEHRVARSAVRRVLWPSTPPSAVSPAAAVANGQARDPPSCLRPVHICPDAQLVAASVPQTSFPHLSSLLLGSCARLSSLETPEGHETQDLHTLALETARVPVSVGQGLVALAHRNASACQTVLYHLQERLSSAFPASGPAAVLPSACHHPCLRAWDDDRL